MLDYDNYNPETIQYLGRVRNLALGRANIDGVNETTPTIDASKRAALAALGTYPPGPRLPGDVVRLGRLQWLLDHRRMVRRDGALARERLHNHNPDIKYLVTIRNRTRGYRDVTIHSESWETIDAAYRRWRAANPASYGAARLWRVTPRGRKLLAVRYN